MAPLASPFPLRWLAAAILVLGTIAWGGGTTQEAQVVVLAGIGALLIFAPAPQGPPRAFAWIAAAWLVLASTAWWPDAWFSAGAWHSAVTEAGINLPLTHSPQPTLSAEAFGWLFAGLAWTGWLSASAPGSSARRWTIRVLAGGIIVLAVVALVAWRMHWAVPGWLSERGFGPFPNRNHTGHVLALGGILALACAMNTGSRRPLVAVLWGLGAAVIVAGLVVNYSRGGLLLFFGAGALWAGLAAWQQRSWKIAALTGSALLAGGAVVLLAGGAVAERFAGGADSQIAFRPRIWSDTLTMISAAPWCGHGLGNFTALFPFFRQASVIQQAIWHPESDWLWLAAENSWLGVLLAASAFAVLARAAFPLSTESHARLRMPALAAAVGAALHGLVDVPAHRPGSALLALLVLALARYDFTPRRPSTAGRWFWRAAGLLILGLACWRAGEKDALANARGFIKQARPTEAHAAADRALLRAPLDWQAYYVRALATAEEGHVFAALGDFRRARLLEPHYAGIPLEEGRFWASRVPQLALPAWSEALRRTAPPADREIFSAMLNAAPATPAFQAALIEITNDRPALQIQWLMGTSAAEAAPHVALLRRLIEQAKPAQADALRARLSEIEALAPK